MKKCIKCQHELQDGAVYCNVCGTKQIDKKLNKKMIFKILVLILIFFAAYKIYDMTHCQVNSCNNKTATDSDYCIYHKCDMLDCTSKASNGSSYCYYHQGLLDFALKNNLEISYVSVNHNSSYTVATGTIRNNGYSTVDFIKVKGAFKTYSGEVIDTDWTYAVGTEGLEPGESTTFRLSVQKNTSIRNCDVTIID